MEKRSLLLLILVALSVFLIGCEGNSGSAIVEQYTVIGVVDNGNITVVDAGKQYTFSYSWDEPVRVNDRVQWDPVRREYVKSR